MTGERFYNIAGKAVGLAILALIVYWLYGEIFKSDSGSSSVESTVSAADSTLHALSVKHNAVLFDELTWHFQSDSTNNRPLYTLDVEEGLTGTNGRPVGIILILDDLIRSDSQYIGFFSEPSSKIILMPHFLSRFLCNFEFKITPEDKDYLLAQKGSSRFGQCFALVARINNCTRARFELNSFGYEEEESFYESEITIEAPGLILIKGQVLEVVYLEDCF